MAVQLYPLDFESLQKGDVIPVEKVEEIARVKRDHPRFNFAALHLAKRIETELADRGRAVTVRSEHGALVICTDEDASNYNERRVKAQARGMGRSVRRMVSVDRTNLSTERLPVHDRKVEIYGKMYSAMTRVRRQLTLVAANRTTPALSEADGNGDK